MLFNVVATYLFVGGEDGKASGEEDHEQKNQGEGSIEDKEYHTHDTGHDTLF